MSQIVNQLLTRYLDDAIAAEESLESALRRFAHEGDDQDVQAAFLAHADVCKQHHELLSHCLAGLAAQPSSSKSFLANLLNLVPKIAQAGYSVEERTVQNLIAAFSVENSHCALYNCLLTTAQAAGNVETQTLARDIEAEKRTIAEALWRFLPSRSKIAFNMQTLDEVDVAIETKAAQSRIR